MSQPLPGTRQWETLEMEGWDILRLQDGEALTQYHEAMNRRYPLPDDHCPWCGTDCDRKCEGWKVK